MYTYSFHKYIWGLHPDLHGTKVCFNLLDSAAIVLQGREFLKLPFLLTLLTYSTLLAFCAIELWGVFYKVVGVISLMVSVLLGCVHSYDAWCLFCSCSVTTLRTWYLVQTGLLCDGSHDSTTWESVTFSWGAALGYYEVVVVSLCFWIF